MSYRTILEIVASVFVAILLWNAARDKTVPVGQYHEAQKAPEIKLVPTEQLTCKPITVYVPIAKQETQLPPEIANDKDKFVLSADTIKSDRHPQELVTVYDDKTGKVESFTRKTDYPWLQALQTGYVGVGYGFTGRKQSGYSLFAHEDLLAIKALRLGVDAELSTGGSVFAGVSASYGW